MQLPDSWQTFADRIDLPPGNETTAASSEGTKYKLSGAMSYPCSSGRNTFVLEHFALQAGVQLQEETRAIVYGSLPGLFLCHPRPRHRQFSSPIPNEAGRAVFSVYTVLHRFG